MTDNRSMLRVNRTLLIAAPIETVFSFFQDSARFAAWWGAGSRIEPRAGGVFHVVNPGGAIAGGIIEVIVAPTRIVTTWGYANSSSIPLGSTRLEITLETTPAGTLVRLEHSGIPATGDMPEQAQGWRYQLAQFSRAVAQLAHGQAAQKLDTWFAAWNTTDAKVRQALLAECCESDVAFRDAFSATVGAEDLVPHLAGFHKHMPGLNISRQGDPALCHNTALVGWVAQAAGGKPMGAGRNFVEFSPSGKIARVFGFWG